MRVSRVHSRSSAVLIAILLPMLVWPARVRAQSDADAGPVLRTAKQVRTLLTSRASRLQTSAGPDPDTVYVGKSFSNHVAPDNYWNIYTGKYLPGVNDPTNAFWDFDRAGATPNAVRIQVSRSFSMQPRTLSWISINAASFWVGGPLKNSSTSATRFAIL